MRRRLVAGAVVFAIWTAGIEARLVYLQVIAHHDLMQMASRQQLDTIDAPAKRGDIRDRNGHVLANNVDADSIFADPTEVEDPDQTARLICGALKHCDETDRSAMAKNLRRKGRFAYLVRRVSPEEEERVRALALKGVGVVKESRRFYPKRELLAHVLGYVGLDNVGLEGLEWTYDAKVRGRPGRILIQSDARRNALSSRVEREATAGAALELTIDQFLQNIAERELRAGVDTYNARGGTGRRHGPSLRRDPRAGELADLQPERVQQSADRGPPEPRDSGSVRARLDIQSGDRIGGAGGRRDRALASASRACGKLGARPIRVLPAARA
jgi:cell division protein FtsI (penicillin-binding protein 3)